MINKSLISYLIAFLLIVASFMVGYYFGRISEKELVKNEQIKEAQTLMLKVGEDRHRLAGTIVSVDTTKTPKEIVIFVTPDRFIIPPPPGLQRTILIHPHTPIVAGLIGPEAMLSKIEITDLKPEDDIVIRTYESVLDLLTRDTYNAILVRKFIATNQLDKKNDN